MTKCGKCGKRIWFWQSYGFVNIDGDETRYHLGSCYDAS